MTDPGMRVKCKYIFRLFYLSVVRKRNVYATFSCLFSKNNPVYRIFVLHMHLQILVLSRAFFFDLAEEIVVVVVAVVVVLVILPLNSFVHIASKMNNSNYSCGPQYLQEKNSGAPKPMARRTDGRTGKPIDHLVQVFPALRFLYAGPKWPCCRFFCNFNKIPCD